jgi:hypothetical protein
MVSDNYLDHLCCHTWPDNTIPELSTEGNNYIVIKKKKKGKAIAATGREGPKGSKMSRLPHFV